LVSQNKNNPVAQVDRALDIEQMIKRLDMFDERLDNVDTVLTSLVERVMERPLTIELSCPKCGQPIQVAITSSLRLRGKE
jgi:tetrahydromethanopterin S-methyltransferase subunit G